MISIRSLEILREYISIDKYIDILNYLFENLIDKFKKYEFLDIYI